MHYITTLCYIEKENDVLLMFRNKKKNDPNKGKWIRIGGKVEPHETLIDAMKQTPQTSYGIRILRAARIHIEARISPHIDLIEPTLHHQQTIHTKMTMAILPEQDIGLSMNRSNGTSCPSMKRAGRSLYPT